MWTAFLGLLDQSKRSASGVQEHKLKRIITHPSFNDFTFDYDIALLELEKPAEYSTVVRPICLPDNTHVFPAGKAIWVTGWGHTKEGGEFQAGPRPAEGFCGIFDVLTFSVQDIPCCISDPSAAAMLCSLVTFNGYTVSCHLLSATDLFICQPQALGLFPNIACKHDQWGVSPVSFPHVDWPVPGAACLSPWLTVPTGTGALILQKGEIRVINQTTCEELLPQQITPRMMCVGFLSGGVDSCQVRGLTGERGRAGRGGILKGWGKAGPGRGRAVQNAKGRGGARERERRGGGRGEGS